MILTAQEVVKAGTAYDRRVGGPTIFWSCDNGRVLLVFGLCFCPFTKGTKDTI